MLIIGDYLVIFPLHKWQATNKGCQWQRAQRAQRSGSRAGAPKVFHAGPARGLRFGIWVCLKIG